MCYKWWPISIFKIWDQKSFKTARWVKVAPSSKIHISNPPEKRFVRKKKQNTLHITWVRTLSSFRKQKKRTSAPSRARRRANVHVSVFFQKVLEIRVQFFSFQGLKIMGPFLSSQNGTKHPLKPHPKWKSHSCLKYIWQIPPKRGLLGKNAVFTDFSEDVIVLRKTKKKHIGAFACQTACKRACLSFFPKSTWNISSVFFLPRLTNNETIFILADWDQTSFKTTP